MSRILSSLTVAAVLLSSTVSLSGSSGADDFIFDYEMLSRAVYGDGYVRYEYLAFSVDQGPGYTYKDLGYINDIFPEGEDAYNSINWDTLQVWTNAGSTEDWLALFEHGYIKSPIGGGHHWGDKWNVPNSAEGLRPDGDSVSFVELSTYSWEGFGDEIVSHAEDPDDLYLAFSFQSTSSPEIGEWWAKSGKHYIENGSKLVPSAKAVPIHTVVSEAPTRVLLLLLVASVSWVGRKRLVT